MCACIIYFLVILSHYTIRPNSITTIISLRALISGARRFAMRFALKYCYWANAGKHFVGLKASAIIDNNVKGFECTRIGRPSSEDLCSAAGKIVSHKPKRYRILPYDYVRPVMINTLSVYYYIYIYARVLYASIWENRVTV